MQEKQTATKDHTMYSDAIHQSPSITGRMSKAISCKGTRLAALNRACCQYATLVTAEWKNEKNMVSESIGHSVLSIFASIRKCIMMFSLDRRTKA